jgi:hypothetical protein
MCLHRGSEFDGLVTVPCVAAGKNSPQRRRDREGLPRPVPTSRDILCVSASLWFSYSFFKSRLQNSFTKISCNLRAGRGILPNQAESRRREARWKSHCKQAGSHISGLEKSCRCIRHRRQEAQLSALGILPLAGPRAGTSTGPPSQRSGQRTSAGGASVVLVLRALPDATKTERESSVDSLTGP